MSLKQVCFVLSLGSLLFSACTHVGTKVGNISKGGFTTVVLDAGHGGKDNGGSGLHPEYGSGYYAAFVFDPDGYRIEAVINEQF